MKEAGVVFEDGLTNEEIQEIESKFGFQFPPDLKQFYQLALPVSYKEVDDVGKFTLWGKALTDKGEAETISYFQEWIFEGIKFDVLTNSFWMDAWGEKPSDQDEQIKIARKHFDQAPRLIPIFEHRCMSSIPHEEGNPVFSIWQTDSIVYGANLNDYLEREFHLKDFKDTNINPTSEKQIPFWSDMVDMNNNRAEKYWGEVSKKAKENGVEITKSELVDMFMVLNTPIGQYVSSCVVYIDDTMEDFWNNFVSWLWQDIKMFYEDNGKSKEEFERYWKEGLKGNTYWLDVKNMCIEVSYDMKVLYERMKKNESPQENALVFVSIEMPKDEIMKALEKRIKMVYGKDAALTWKSAETA